MEEGVDLVSLVANLKNTNNEAFVVDKIKEFIQKFHALQEKTTSLEQLMLTRQTMENCAETAPHNHHSNSNEGKIYENGLDKVRANGVDYCEDDQPCSKENSYTNESPSGNMMSMQQMP